jgi:hypothetical protein
VSSSTSLEEVLSAVLVHVNAPSEIILAVHNEVSVVSENSALHKYEIAAILVLEVEDFGEERTIAYFSLAK